MQHRGSTIDRQRRSSSHPALLPATLGGPACRGHVVGEESTEPRVGQDCLPVGVGQHVRGPFEDEAHGHGRNPDIRGPTVVVVRH